MSEEIDDKTYYREDFTTATEWEVFNAQFEEIIRELKELSSDYRPVLAKNQLSLCNWDILLKQMKFADFDIDLKLYSAQIRESDGGIVGDGSVDDSKEYNVKTNSHSNILTYMDLMSKENEYAITDDNYELSNIHPIARWYGLRTFVILSSAVPHQLFTESQTRILTSSIHVAIGESGYEQPIFLETRPGIFTGVCEYQSTRVQFDIIHLHNIPPSMQYLDGLTRMFRSNFNEAYGRIVFVWIRQTYILPTFIGAQYKCKRKYAFCEYNNDNLETSDDVESDLISLLPIGVPEDPINELVLYCSWPNFNIYYDYSESEYRTNYYKPLDASSWSVRIRFGKTDVESYLNEIFTEYLQNCNNKRALMRPINNNKTSDGISLLASVLLDNTGSYGARQLKRQASGPIEQSLLLKWFYYLFPDSEQGSKYMYAKVDETNSIKIKSAHPDSLIHRLSALLALSNCYLGYTDAICQVWMEFTKEIRYRWENGIIVPG